MKTTFDPVKGLLTQALYIHVLGSEEKSRLFTPSNRTAFETGLK